MKKLENLGKKLDKADQKKVLGGAKPWWDCVLLGQGCNTTVWQHPCCDGLVCSNQSGGWGECVYYY